MNTAREWGARIRSLLDIPLFTLGTTPFTLWSLLYLIVLLVLLVYLTAQLKNLIVNRILARRGIDVGIRQATGSIVRYIMIVIGVMIILETAGIDLSTITILAGAFGVGIGFGLQTITNNFVSGIIIHFERPIKVGDRIEVGQVIGDVVRISPRATTVVTNDNIAVIVPNSEFITSKVINWSYTGRDVRFSLPVGVSYEADPEFVRDLLVQVAESHPGVLKSPKPTVLFEGFGESSLNFSLQVWTREYTARPGMLCSELNYRISKKFREHAIEIPFPQREIRIRGGFPKMKPPETD